MLFPSYRDPINGTLILGDSHRDYVAGLRASGLGLFTPKGAESNGKENRKWDGNWGKIGVILGKWKGWKLLFRFRV